MTPASKPSSGPLFEINAEEDAHAEGLAALTLIEQRLMEYERVVAGYAEFDDVIAALSDARRTKYGELQDALAALYSPKEKP